MKVFHLKVHTNSIAAFAKFVYPCNYVILGNILRTLVGDGKLVVQGQKTAPQGVADQVSLGLQV